ncbi:MAG: type II toxin-antitoxin system HicA family toxin [Bacteroidales bacterium]|nr:type II toxin-antitoxin system HicA family toxin [Bacteroidales bacterium]
MSSKDKLIERFRKLPADFTFDEMRRMLQGMGYEECQKGLTSGSRVMFKNSEHRPIMLHRPHPGNVVKRYAMKQVLDELIEVGLIKD